ncbi:YwiC-like family protein [Sutcliffiella cohnii]
MKLVLPKQHGAWAMLLIPFLLSAFIGNASILHIPLFLGWLLLYLSTYPFLMAIKKKKPSLHWKWFFYYAFPALLFLIIVLYYHFPLFYFGVSLIPFFLINIYFARQKNERALLNDISAIIVFCIAGLASYHVGVESIDRTAWLLFMFNFLFFVGSTFYVKTMIREKNNRKYLFISWGYHIIAVVGMLFINPLLIIAFIPSLFRAFYFYGKSLSIMKLGIYEIINSALFFFTILLVFLK